MKLLKCSNLACRGNNDRFTTRVILNADRSILTPLDSFSYESFRCDYCGAEAVAGERETLQCSNPECRDDIKLPRFVTPLVHATERIGAPPQSLKSLPSVDFVCSHCGSEAAKSEVVVDSSSTDQERELAELAVYDPIVGHALRLSIPYVGQLELAVINLVTDRNRLIKEAEDRSVFEAVPIIYDLKIDRATVRKSPNYVRGCNQDQDLDLSGPEYFYSYILPEVFKCCYCNMFSPFGELKDDLDHNNIHLCPKCGESGCCVIRHEKLSDAALGEIAYQNEKKSESEPKAWPHSGT